MPAVFIGLLLALALALAVVLSLRAEAHRRTKRDARLYPPRYEDWPQGGGK